MEQHVLSRRRVAGGLACVAAGAMVLALGAAPAGATGGPEVQTGPGWNADQLSDELGGNWVEVEVPFQSGRYELGDGSFVDVQVQGDEFSWSSNGQEIGAVEVQGDGESNLYTYGGGHGSRSGHGLSGPGQGGVGHGGWGSGGGWGGGGGHGHKIGFCWKGGGHHPPPTHPPTTPPPSTPTTAPPTTAPPTTAPPETTVPPTTAPPTTEASTTTLPETEATTPTTQPVGEQLPRTGSNTVPLVVGAVLLVALGGGAFAGRRYLQQRES